MKTRKITRRVINVCIVLLFIIGFAKTGIFIGQYNEIALGAETNQVIINEVISSGSEYIVKGVTPAGADKKVSIFINRKDKLPTELDNIIIAYVVRSSEDGSFEFSFSMPDIDRKGQDTYGGYVVYARSEDAESSIGKEFFYVSGTYREMVIQKIISVNGTEDERIAELRSILALDSPDRNALSSIGVLMSGYDNLSDNGKDELCRALLTYNISSDENEFKQQANKLIALSSINNSTEETIEDILVLYENIFNLVYKEGITYQTILNEENTDKREWINERILDISDYDDVEKVTDRFMESYALYLVNNSHYSLLEGVLEENKSILELENNSNYSYYNTSNNKNSINEKLLEEAFNNPFKTVTDFINKFDTVLNDWKSQGGQTGNRIGTGGGGGTTVRVTPSVDVAPIEPNQDTKDEVIFNDLDDAPWAKDNIIRLASKGIIDGAGYNQFKPNDKVTREQFTKMIVVAFELIDKDADSNFDDVHRDEWYYTYIASAQKSGIIQGVDESYFGIGREISREEMVVIIYRVIQQFGLEAPQDSAIIEFVDKEEISPYALEGAELMQQAGIISGVGENRFAPKDTTTRAQAAIVIDRLLDLRY